MRHEFLKHMAFAIATAAALATVALWSWNTLAGLAGLPGAEFRHALAAVSLLMVVRALVAAPNRGPRSRRHARPRRRHAA